MVSRKRWLEAQKYEQSYWVQVANGIVSGVREQLSWYAWRASEMEKRLDNYCNAAEKQSAKVLELGSGPIGIVSFLKWGERYTIDPLENYYQKNPVLTQLRNSAVHYADGHGEKLPFGNGCFLLVIFDNVLDHVHNAIGVLHEIQRVLSQDGSLYLVVNIHTKWGSFVHSILSKLKIDKGHPYTFTYNSIRRFLNDGGFIVSYEKLEDYCQIKRKNCQAKNLKDKIKGYSGISEIVYTCICHKKSFNCISQGAHDNGRKKVF